MGPSVQHHVDLRRQSKAADRRPHADAASGARIGLNCYHAIRSLRRPVRKLVAPDPALITHMETPYVALGTDWRSLADSTQQWAVRRRLTSTADRPFC